MEEETHVYIMVSHMYTLGTYFQGFVVVGGVGRCYTWYMMLQIWLSKTRVSIDVSMVMIWGENANLPMFLFTGYGQTGTGDH